MSVKKMNMLAQRRARWSQSVKSKMFLVTKSLLFLLIVKKKCVYSYHYNEQGISDSNFRKSINSFSDLIACSQNR